MVDTAKRVWERKFKQAKMRSRQNAIRKTRVMRPNGQAIIGKNGKVATVVALVDVAHRLMISTPNGRMLAPTSSAMVRSNVLILMIEEYLMIMGI